MDSHVLGCATIQRMFGVPEGVDESSCDSG